MVSSEKQPYTMVADRTQTSELKLKRMLAAGMLAYLGLLVWYSFYLSQWRIYQVDECQSLYMSRIVATGQAHEFFTDGSLFLFGPLAWITTHFHQSVQMFDAARLLFLGIFWLNIALMAGIASGRLFSYRGLVALVAAGSLAPVWDYGFEIRHDNVVLAGVLLIWWTVRVKHWGLPAYLLTGAITVICFFIAVKSVVYVIPLSGALLLLPSRDQNKPRLRLIAAWMGGCVLALVVIRLIYGSSGGWDTYLGVFRAVSRYSAASNSGADVSGRFWPGIALQRLPEQTPLLLALVVAACVSVAGGLIRNFRSAFTWEGNVPEMLLFLGALGDLFLNPTPYPYNLLHLVPYAFILSFRYGADVWSKIRPVAVLRPVTVGVVIFTNFVPFIMATERHLDYTNVRQKMLMSAAEALTDPVKDPVYDGIGMVPTRTSINHQWYIHGLNIALKTPGLQVHEMLAANPAAVVIFSYRTGWLPPKDMDFIRSRYVPLANDISVLGTVLPAGGGSFEVFHPGRYCLVAAASPPGQKSGTSTTGDENPVAGTLDGVPVSERPIELKAGTHRIETSPNHELAVVWVGPNLQGIPLLNPYDYRLLFQNWY